MTGVAGSSSVMAMPGPSARPWRSLPAEIAPGVFHRAISGSNVYFVRSGSSWVLIDTSWANRGPLIKQTAERLFGVGHAPRGNPAHACARRSLGLGAGAGAELGSSGVRAPRRAAAGRGKVPARVWGPDWSLVDQAVDVSHAPA